MKQFPLALLVILLFILAGCEAEQRMNQDGETGYSSATSAEDCYLWGGRHRKPGSVILGAGQYCAHQLKSL